jgi:BlaI family transcriptional regulator, penicillinase repressor
MAENAALSKRERQIMDVIYAKGPLSAVAVWEAMVNPPSAIAVRTLLGILESKGHLRHKKVGRQFIFMPTRPKAKAGRSALRRVIEVFFDKSPANALAAHLADTANLSDEELERLAHIVDQARQRGGTHEP